MYIKETIIMSQKTAITRIEYGVCNFSMKLELHQTYMKKNIS